jgi:hypothetical protein
MTRYKVTTIGDNNPREEILPTGKTRYSVTLKPEKAAKLLQPDHSRIKK